MFRSALALSLLVAMLATGCGGSSTLGAGALAKRSDTVRSLAAEGALLAQDAASGRSTSVYLREHSSELATTVSTAETSLQRAKTSSALRPTLRRLRRLAREVRSQLRRLSGASSTEQRSIARTLQAAAVASEKVGRELA